MLFTRMALHGQPLRLGTFPGQAALAATILASGMAFLDSTAVNVALPEMGRQLGADFAGLQWILNGYLLTLSALVLIGGSLGDRYGRRRVFLLGNAAFAGASFLCGLAPGAGFLIGFRLAQGMGAALLIPTSLALIRDCFPEEEGQAVGLWSGLTGISALIGPLLGGWFADAISWRMIFFINPVLSVAIFALARYLPDTREKKSGEPDWPGAATAAIALGGITYGLIQGPKAGWDQASVGMIVLGALGLLLFGLIESRSEHPMLPMGLLRRRPFVAVNAVTFFVYFVLSGAFFLLVLVLQKVHGYSALQAGLTLAPITFLLLVLSPGAGKYAGRKGPRLPMTLGPWVAALGAALLTRVADYPHSFAADVLPGIVAFGIGLGLTVAPLTATALSALEVQQAGLAAGVNNMVARVAQLLAIPLLPLAAGISGMDAIGGPAFLEGFVRALWVATGLLIMGGVLSALTIKT